MNCKNCGFILESNFCSNCGQSSKVRSLTFSNFLTDFFESLFQVNAGVIYTITQLSKRPGDSVKEFLIGKRKSHFKPIAYALVFSTLYFFVSRIAGQNTIIYDLILGFSTAAFGTSEDLLIPMALTWFSENYAYATLLILPLFSVASTIAFSGQKFNYLEHIVLNAYITGHQAIFYSVFVLLRIFFKSNFFEIAPLVVALLYTFWVYFQFFNRGNRILNILRSILTYVLYWIVSFGLLSAITLI